MSVKDVIKADCTDSSNGLLKIKSFSFAIILRLERKTLTQVHQLHPSLLTFCKFPVDFQ